ncbi:MAG: hypothetical protein R3Y44_03825 [Rikenellaceae bacterium]
MLRARRISPLLAALLAVGCSTHVDLAELTEVDPAGWFSPAEIRFEVADTVSRAQMQLIVRYDNIISADSVELLVSTTTPDGVMWCEPFTVYTPHGDHSILLIESLYRDKIRWSQMGTYTISLHPQQLYRGVSAVGVNIIYKE